MFLSAFSPLYQGNGTMATELPVLHVAFAAASASARWACHARVRKSNSRTPFFTHYFPERFIPFVDITGTVHVFHNYNAHAHVQVPSACRDQEAPQQRRPSSREGKAPEG